MTTLLSWVSYSDTGEAPHLPRAVYLVSDSRITWGSPDRRWEAGRQVFAPAREPHLFGFCGDVVLPALILGQIISAIDAKVLFDGATAPAERHEIVFNAVERGVSRAIATPTMDFTIHHLARERVWPDTSFRGWNIVYDTKSRACTSVEVSIPDATEVIASFGSGHVAAKAHRGRWQGSEAAGRSRAIFSAFCDSVRSGDDPLSGGPPQLAALYTKGAPAQIGLYLEGRRVINGLEVNATASLRNSEWRNELGQSVDPLTGERAAGARRFARPRKLAGS